jgi:hypothetical protein
MVVLVEGLQPMVEDGEVLVVVATLEVAPVERLMAVEVVDPLIPVQIRIMKPVPIQATERSL